MSKVKLRVAKEVKTSFQAEFPSKVKVTKLSKPKWLKFKSSQVKEGLQDGDSKLQAQVTSFPLPECNPNSPQVYIPFEEFT